jgi:serine phosphatase RsbU (regulator of sigma subunit)
VDPDGTVAYWNRGAEELFGHRWEQVFGHPADGLLRAHGGPGTVGADGDTDAFDLLDRLARTAWAGTLTVTDRDGALREVLCWAYRLGDTAGPSLLVLAAAVAPLRAGGLRVALGEGGAPLAAEAPAPGQPAPAVRAHLAGAPDAAYAGRLAARLAGLLPRAAAGRVERVARRIGAAGHPVLTVGALPPLPVLPFPERADQGERQEGGALPVPRRQAGVSQAVPRSPHRPGRAMEEQRALLRATGARVGTTLDLRATAQELCAVAVPAFADLAAVLVVDQLFSDAEARDEDGGDGGGARTVVVRRVAVAQAHPPTTEPAPTSPAPASPEPAPAAVRADRTTPRADASATGTAPVTTAPATTASTTTAPCATASSANATRTTAANPDADAASATGPTGTGPGAPGNTAHPGPGTDHARAPEPPSGARATRRHPTPNPTDGPFTTAFADAIPEGELIALPDGPGVPRVADPVHVPVIDAAVAADLAADLGAPGLGPLIAGHSLLVVPLVARGTALGRMCLLRGPGRRPFSARDAATAAEVADRAAVHLDNVRLHRQESRAAATLQRSMMPTRPPRLPGVRIAHHYRPGDRQAQVGGDWFDALQLPGGRVALVVGDVMGHGLLSAAVMGQFRTSVITMAALDLPPAQLLRHLDNLAHRLGAEHLATCVYAVYDPVHRTLTLANAGHIPPVLARPDGRSELLDIPQGAPIGVGGVPFETVEVPVPDGSWLVLCTDGLVEVRGQGIDAGLAALCSHVIEPHNTPEEVCQRILGEVHSGERRDDVALLVANFEGVDPADVIEWRLGLSYSEVARARALTRAQLARWGLGALTDLTGLLVSELVTNAVRAASHEVSLRLMRVGKLLVEVIDDDHNLPHLRGAAPEDESGRGLALVSNLSRRWGTSRLPVGKVVWFELPLPG